jgi:hypothetical protein
VRQAGDDARAEPWEPWDDATSIIVALMNIDAKLDELGTHVVVIRSLLEDDEEAEED